MEQLIQKKFKKNQYELFLLPIPLKNKKKKSLRVKKYIDIPKICPICGSQKVVYSRRIRPTFFFHRHKLDSPERNKLKIYFCNNHSRNKKKEIFKGLVYLLLMTIIPLIIIIYLIVYITVQMTLLAIILSGISFGIGLYGYTKEYRKDKRYLRMIKKSFFFEVYCFIGAILSINFFKWAIELKKLNKCYRVKNIDFEKLHDLKDLAMKYEKKMYYSALFACMTVVGMLITIIIFRGLIDSYFIFIFSLIITLFFWGLFLYEFQHYYSINKQRFRIFQVFFRKNPI